jgi:hypothetical protein
MSINDQVRSLAENIEASYETRIAAISDIVEEAHQTLGNFNREHEKMAGNLRRSLASNRSERASQVQRMRAEHDKELKEMAQKMAEFLSASEKERRKEFAALIGEIKGVVAAIEKDTAQALADFRSDHKEMAEALKTNPSSETKEMLSHFTKEHEEMAGSLRSELSSFQRHLAKVVDDMLAGFSADHQQARTHWENLAKEMAAKRAGKSAPSAKTGMGIPTSVKEKRRKEQ